jgi:hypothetical protein
MFPTFVHAAFNFMCVFERVCVCVCVCVCVGVCFGKKSPLVV